MIFFLLALHRHTHQVFKGIHRHEFTTLLILILYYRTCEMCIYVCASTRYQVFINIRHTHYPCYKIMYRDIIEALLLWSQAINTIHLNTYHGTWYIWCSVHSNAVLSSRLDNVSLIVVFLFLLPSDNVQHDLQHGSLITFPKEENLGNKKGHPCTKSLVSFYMRLPFEKTTNLDIFVCSLSRAVNRQRAVLCRVLMCLCSARAAIYAHQTRGTRA